MQKIGIINYGIGNLRSIANALVHLGVTPVVSHERHVLEPCSHLILPGVGAFGHVMACLRAHDLAEWVIEQIDLGKPLLGICVGMQMLLQSSHEFGQHQGLGVLQGSITALDEAPPPTPPCAYLMLIGLLCNGLIN